MEPFTAFWTSYPENSARGLTTFLGGAELIDSSPGHFSELTIYGSGTAHDTCYNAHFQRGDKTTKNEDGEKQGKTGLGVSKAIEKSGDLIC